MSDQVIIGLVIMGVILIITLGAIWKYPQVGPVLQLWAGFGTLTGAMATYFFTREQVQRQESQVKMYRAAFQASEKEKAEAGEQFLEIAAKIKPDLTSLQNQQLLQKYELMAKDLTKMKIWVGKNGDGVIYKGAFPFASPPEDRP